MSARPRYRIQFDISQWQKSLQTTVIYVIKATSQQATSRGENSLREARWINRAIVIPETKCFVCNKRANSIIFVFVCTVTAANTSKRHEATCNSEMSQQLFALRVPPFMIIENTRLSCLKLFPLLHFSLFVCSFIHSFIRSSVYSFNNSFIYLSTCSFIHSFVRSSVRSIIHSFIHLFIPLFHSVIFVFVSEWRRIRTWE